MSYSGSGWFHESVVIGVRYGQVEEGLLGRVRSKQ
jgi:hypothetical protein